MPDEGVLVSHTIRDAPDPAISAERVNIAFGRWCMTQLVKDLAGTLDQQIEAVDKMLELFVDEKKAYEGLDAGLLDVLLFIVIRVEDSTLGKMLEQKILECFELLSKYSFIKQEFIRDQMKLKDLKPFVASPALNLRQYMTNFCERLISGVGGADALFESKYWEIMLQQGVYNEPDVALQQQMFHVLSKMKKECKINSPVGFKAEIGDLINHLHLGNGESFLMAALELSMSLSRERKEDFLDFGTLSKINRLVQENYGELSAKCRAKLYQFLTTLLVPTDGKLSFVDEFTELDTIIEDEGIYTIETLQLPGVQLLLMLSEHPKIRQKLLKHPTVVEKLKAIETKNAFLQKMVKKTLDSIHWVP